MVKYKANIRNLIALCHVIDKFDEFKKSLTNNISTKNNRNFISSIWKISTGKFSINNKARKFYEENINVIDTINKYSDINMFICRFYTDTGKQYWDNSLDYFHSYLLKHKHEINKIIRLLEKIKDLGYEELEFNEDLDFTKEIHSLHTDYFSNRVIPYYDNLTVIPNYDSTIITYQTTGSNYKLDLVAFRRDTYKITPGEIILNDLTLNPDRLPKTISKSETYNKILELKDKDKISSIIKDTVYLNISIDDLYHEFESTNKVINSLKNVTEKEELIKYLSSIKEMILKMQEISSLHNKTLESSKEAITEEVINEEIKRYLFRREDYNIDLC